MANYISKFNAVVRIQYLLSMCAIVSIVSPASALETDLDNRKALSMEIAIELAQLNDPWLYGNKSSQDAIESTSIAVGALPDPRMSIGVANLATDTFDFDQEGMTQFKVALSQSFPRGDSLAIKRKQLELIGSQYPYQRQDRKAKIAVIVGLLWLDSYGAQESIDLIENDRALFEQLADIAQASYSAALGRTRQQDIIRAQLELARLEDRLTIFKQRQEMHLQRLSEWLSSNFQDQYSGHHKEEPLLHFASLMLENKLPDTQLLNPQLYSANMQISPQNLFEYFVYHPAVIAVEQKIKASDKGIELAKQKYKPEWGINASYGYRDDDSLGNDRADLLSVGVSFDLPIFTSNRQDKEVQSAVSQTEAVKTEKWLLVRKLIASFETSRVKLKRLDERRNLYQSEILPQMDEQAEASLTAYTNDDGDFAEVVRARIAELNASIDALNIDVEKQKAIIQLNYLFTTTSDEIGATVGIQVKTEEQPNE